MHDIRKQPFWQIKYFKLSSNGSAWTCHHHTHQKDAILVQCSFFDVWLNQSALAAIQACNYSCTVYICKYSFWDTGKCEKKKNFVSNMAANFLWVTLGPSYVLTKFQLPTLLPTLELGVAIFWKLTEWLERWHDTHIAWVKIDMLAVIIEWASVKLRHVLSQNLEISHIFIHNLKSIEDTVLKFCTLTMCTLNSMYKKFQLPVICSFWDSNDSELYLQYFSSYGWNFVH